MIFDDSDGYYHPASEEELRALIHKAQERGSKLRVRGAGHSEPAAFERVVDRLLASPRFGEGLSRRSA